MIASITDRLTSQFEELLPNHDQNGKRNCNLIKGREGSGNGRMVEGCYSNSSISP